jgi:hypothetical protein
MAIVPERECKIPILMVLLAVAGAGFSDGVVEVESLGFAAEDGASSLLQPPDPS